MSEELEDGLPEGDRLGPTLAIFAAVAMYIAGTLAAGSFLFGLLAAAAVGTGVRLYMMYHVNRKASDSRGSSLEEFQVTGNYHYGAVGGALVIGPLFTTVLALLEPDLRLAVAVGGLSAFLTYALIQFALPK